jgi:hypothetical protein
MDLDLKNKEWREFVIAELFSVKIGKNIDGNKINKKIGKSAYITRKVSNNGLDGFINSDKKLMNYEFPVITIGNETAEPFVQVFPFFTGTKVNILMPKKALSKWSLLFIAQSLKMHKPKYSYSFTVNSTRLRKQKILLPINEKGEPDYEFMDTFMREKEQESLKRYESYVSNGNSGLGQAVKSLNEVEWGEFEIKEIAKILSGKDIYGAERIKGKTPYISATSNNNGIGHFVGNDNKTKESECLSVNRNGSVGYSFYHHYEALFSNDCRKLRLKKPNKYVGIFISQQITRQRGKYGYGYKMGTARLKRQKILLPITSNGKPDYEYMESYMKKIEHEKLLNYIEKRLTN